jgi:hypothetical protein
MRIARCHEPIASWAVRAAGAERHRGGYPCGKDSVVGGRLILDCATGSSSGCRRHEVIIRMDEYVKNKDSVTNNT